MTPSPPSHVAVRLGRGGRICALAVGSHVAKQGAAVILSLRPEPLALLRGDADAPNALAGSIRQIVYVGDHIRVLCTVDGVGTLIVKIPNISGAHDLSVGAAIRLGCQTEDCLALAP